MTFQKWRKHFKTFFHTISVPDPNLSLVSVLPNQGGGAKAPLPPGPPTSLEIMVENGQTHVGRLGLVCLTHV